MLNTKFIDDLARQISDSIPAGVKGLQADMEKNIHTLLQGALGKLDLVTREDFDAQAAVLRRTREKLEQLEPFHPDRMASTILGMGDVLTLVEKAQAVVDEKQAAELEKKLRKSQFTLEDFKDQMVQVRKMGSLSDLVKMIPGVGSSKQFKNLQVDDGELVKVEAIINSMTREERRRHQMINGSRRRRIARGSGTSIQDVNRLLKNYTQVLKMMKKLNQRGMRGLQRGMLPF